MSTPQSASHLLHVFPTFEADGMELIAVRVMNGLGAGYRHTIVPLRQRKGAEAHIARDVQYELMEPPPGAGSPFYARAMAGLIRAVRPDVLLTYNWGAMDAVIAAVLGGLCPVVHHEHGFGAEEADARKRRRVLLRRVMLRHAHLTIVISRNLERIARDEFLLRREKLLYIPNGVDVEHFRPGDRAEARRKLGLPQGETLFGFTGNFRAEKNLPMLIDAFARTGLAGARLVLVGDGAARAELEELVRERRLGESVIFTGRMQDPQPALAAMDVFVLSSSTEQMPMSLLEAMACGLPAIVTDVGDCRLLLGAGADEFCVPPGNAEAYAAAIRTLGGGRELRERIGAQLRSRAVEEYSLEGMVRRYESVYHSAAAARRTASASRAV